MLVKDDIINFKVPPPGRAKKPQVSLALSPLYRDLYNEIWCLLKAPDTEE
jgi:hypothetical protein